jgi:hypothetical protein
LPLSKINVVGKHRLWLEVEAANGVIYKNDVVFEIPQVNVEAAICDGYESNLQRNGWTVERKGNVLTVTAYVDKKKGASAITRVHVTSEKTFADEFFPQITPGLKVKLGPAPKKQ